jgi:hypothetical protein
MKLTFSFPEVMVNKRLSKYELEKLQVANSDNKYFIFIIHEFFVRKNMIYNLK